MSFKDKVTLKEIEKAREVLKKHLVPTPLVYSSSLSECFGCNIYLKLENMQPIGSFKIRGATYKISTLNEAEKKRGVIAASAGNHAQGVAWGSRKLGTNALIVMPLAAPLMKVQNTHALGAQVVLHGRNYDEAYTHSQEIVAESKRVFVHAFHDPAVIAGQGTIGLEILEQLPETDVVIASIGGGGLIAGIGTALKAKKKSVTLIGCQASGSPSMVESLRKGQAVHLEASQTFADGIAVKKANEELRELLDAMLDEWTVADEESIASAVLSLLESAKVLSEGAGAVPLAVLHQVHRKYQNKNIVLVVSGGNIDVNLLGRIIDRGLIIAGRRLRFNVGLSDRPGSLAQLTRVIADLGSNVLQAIHDRNRPSTFIDETEVELTLETRGKAHSEEILRALKDASKTWKWKIHDGIDTL